jgi:hypothetical protein
MNAVFRKSSVTEMPRMKKKTLSAGFARCGQPVII